MKIKQVKYFFHLPQTWFHAIIHRNCVFIINVPACSIVGRAKQSNVIAKVVALCRHSQGNKFTLYYLDMATVPVCKAPAIKDHPH